MLIVFSSNLEEFKNEWMYLSDNSECHIFQHYDWINCWYETVGIKKKIRVVIACYKDNKDVPLIIFPFGIVSSFGLRILQWLGDHHTSDYLNPLFSLNFLKSCNQNAFRTLWNQLLSQFPVPFDLMNLRSVPMKIGDDPNPMVYIPGFKVDSFSYSTCANSSWEDYYLKTTTKKLRNDSLRQWKRLQGQGTLSMLCSPSPAMSNEIVKFILKEKSYHHFKTGNKDIFSISLYNNFYIHCTEIMRKNGILKVSAIFLNGSIISAHWGMKYHNTFFYLLPTYSHEYKRYSPGRLLLESLIEQEFRAGTKTFDFTTGSESYKRIWCNAEMKSFYLLKYFSLKGKCAILANTGIQAAFRLCKISPIKSLVHSYRRYLHKI